jgi:hypothetical protein
MSCCVGSVPVTKENVTYSITSMLPYILQEGIPIEAITIPKKYFNCLRLRTKWYHCFCLSKNYVILQDSKGNSIKVIKGSE